MSTDANAAPDNTQAAPQDSNPAPASTDPGNGDGKQPAQGDQQPADNAAPKADDKPAQAADKKPEGDQPGDKPENQENADADKSDQDKPEGAPEQYAEFQLPEGFQVDTVVMGEFQTLAKELNLPQETAQKLVDLQAKVETARAEAFSQQVNDWKSSCQNDKEYGGKDFEANAAVANKALVEYGSPELVKMLQETQLGNHPEMVRAFYKIGKQLEEGGSKRASASASGKMKMTDIYKDPK